MKITCDLVQEVSKNTGRPYVYIAVPINENYSIKLFPNSAEQELIKQLIKNNTTK